jgi:GTP-binding protein
VDERVPGRPSPKRARRSAGKGAPARHDRGDGLRIEARFLVAAPDLARCPSADVPEVAFAGRSNAGKSSVLNQVTGQRRLAHASRTPGRTRLINFFSTRLGGRLVDLPGYGFSRASQAEQRAWRVEIERYLAERRSLAALVIVMDCRHPLEAFDRQLVAWTRVARLPAHLLLNKADKLGHGARLALLRRVERVLAAEIAEGLCTVQLFSAVSGLGREVLIGRLEHWLTPTAPPVDAAQRAAQKKAPDD